MGGVVDYSPHYRTAKGGSMGAVLVAASLAILATTPAAAEMTTRDVLVGYDGKVESVMTYFRGIAPRW
jgi:hypothetical protein